MDYLTSFTSVEDRILYKALYCRYFEFLIQKEASKGNITCPLYLSIGQELVPAAISEILPKASVFAQHRAHSYYLCFGGSPLSLLDKLKSKEGSASISLKGKMFGHSGFMGDQAPIAVGYSLCSKEPVICVLGDASAEEDYVLGSIGYAATKNAPILFLVEDNNLSILTEKKVRRNWSMAKIGQAFNLNYSSECGVDLSALYSTLVTASNMLPALVNISVTRLCWHSGIQMNSPLPHDDLEDLLSESRNEKIIRDLVKKEFYAFGS